jgi:hypothetical protein
LCLNQVASVDQNQAPLGHRATSRVLVARPDGVVVQPVSP